MWGWLSTATGCPERWWTLCLCRSSKAIQTWFWATCFTWPCLSQGIRPGGLQGSLPTAIILLFYESVIQEDLSYQTTSEPLPLPNLLLSPVLSPSFIQKYTLYILQCIWLLFLRSHMHSSLSLSLGWMTLLLSFLNSFNQLPIILGLFFFPFFFLFYFQHCYTNDFLLQNLK